MLENLDNEIVNQILHPELSFWNEPAGEEFISYNVIVKVEHGFDRFNTKA